MLFVFAGYLLLTMLYWSTDHERETLTRLREQIVSYGIIQDQPDCLAMDTDTGPSGTQPTVSKEVYMAVGLWPVMEEVFLRELQAILPDCLQGHDTEEEGAARPREGLAALNWMMAHLPVSPALHLSLRRALARQVSQANTRHWAIVVSMLVHRLRRWPNIETTMAQCLVFAGSKPTMNPSTDPRLFANRCIGYNVD